MKKLLVILLVLSAVHTMGQIPINMSSSGDNSFFLRLFEAQELNSDDDARDTGIKGSRYFNDEFIEGEIFTSDAHFTKVSMRYDTFYDAFQFRISGQNRRLDPQLAIKRIVMGDDIFVIDTYNHNGKNRQGFLQLLIDDKYSLFARKNISLRPAQPPRALETESKPAEYLKKKDTYFVGLPDGNLVEVNSGKDLAKQLGNTSFTAAAKKQKISLKGDKNIVALVKLLNDMDL
jgi:hypothetical protein